MSFDPVTFSLPIADRRTSHAFYADGLGLEAIGEPASDGVPEPLQFVLAGGARLMLVPTGGFGWVVGDRDVAASGTSECIIGVGAASNAAVDELVGRAAAAGATVTARPEAQPWGYTGTFADPDGHLWMVTADPSDG